MSKIVRNVVFGGKRDPAGWFHSQTQVLNTSQRNVFNPNGTKLYLKIALFISSQFREKH